MTKTLPESLLTNSLFNNFSSPLEGLREQIQRTETADPSANYLSRWLVELMLEEDKQDCISNPDCFLEDLLRGETNWQGYSVCSNKQNIKKFLDRRATQKLFFDSEQEEFQLLLSKVKEIESKLAKS